MSDALHRRYPGARPFQRTDTDRLAFKGREDDIERFLHLVLAERLVVLFSKSGTGKTSLLNAGLSQPLREREYIPIPIRLNDPNIPLLDLIDVQVRHIAAEMKTEFVAGDKSSLWKYFKTAEFWGENDSLLIPVVIFDQFEEIFTLEYSQKQQDEFFSQLADLVYGQHPDSVKGDVTTSRFRQPAESLPNMKIILSLREDYLANLEEINADIPSIFRNRFRLRSLNPERARQAITGPALLEHPAFASRPFVFDSKTVDLILDFLQKGGAEAAEHPVGLKGVLPWTFIGLGITLFSYVFDPVIGTEIFGGKTIFMRQPVVLSVTIAFASLILAYFSPMKPVYAFFTAFAFQLFNLLRYWTAVGGSDLSVESKILLTGLAGSAAAGWVSWLRFRQFASVPQERKLRRHTEIEPFQIQLLCQHIEEMVLRRQGNDAARREITVTRNDLGGDEEMQGVLKDFYQVQMKRLTPAKRWVAHKLCERGLISISGKRLSLDGEFIADKYKVSRALLNELIDQHLVRAESRLGSHYYELSHDSLLKPIRETAQQRLRKTRIVLLLGICGALLFFVGKDLMEKASAAKKLVAARNILSGALRISAKDDSVRAFLQELDSILQQQANVLGLDSLPGGMQRVRQDPTPLPSGPSPIPPPPDTAKPMTPAMEVFAAISGKIVDMTTGNGISGAHIVVDGKKKDSVTSGAGGEFAIRDFPAGTYSLKISRSGYKRWERTGLAVLATDLNLGTVKLEAKSVLPPEPSIGAMSGRVLDSDTDVVAATNLLRLLNPDSVKAPYPRAALSDRISGNVKVRVTVVQGRVTDVTVLQAVHPLLDSAAVIAARKGEYRGSGVEKRTYQFLHPGIR